MRIQIALVLSCLLLLVGCSVGDTEPDPQENSVISAPLSEETSSGAAFPADDSTLPHTDSTGRTPAEAQLELIDAKNSSDWESAYSMYADPGMDFELAVEEWEASRTRCENFTVHEVRVIRQDMAILRVTYELQWTQPDGERDVVSITEPGEWWSISMVDGQWRVHWLPRQ